VEVGTGVSVGAGVGVCAGVWVGAGVGLGVGVLSAQALKKPPIIIVQISNTATEG